MKPEDLFWNIFRSRNEFELNEFINSNTELFNPKNWRPYGSGDKFNYGTFESQQDNAIPALVEKITNAIDAILLEKCKLQKIDPKSPQAPQSIPEAVERFFNIKNGDFSEVASKDRRNIAEDIQIIADGDSEAPNLLIYDNGEGQEPDNFENTFLSLFKGNKTEIHFVHGKYNMGSTGAVIFCGNKYRYQLIVSRRQKNLLNGKSSDIGFTLVREHPLNQSEEENLQSSWYEYFTINGKIPRFSKDFLDLGLYGRQFQFGSAIKLFSYQLPRGSRSDITFDLWRDLNQFLYQPAIPFLLHEKRYTGNKTPSKLVLGNKTRIVLDERDKKEITMTLSIEGPDLGIVPVEITVFKMDVKQKEFIQDKAVVFTQNGQVHGAFDLYPKN